MSEAGAEATAEPPLLRVIKGGAPSDEEIAAVAAVLVARAASAGDAEPEPSLRPQLSEWVKSGLVKGTRTKA